MNGEKPYWFTKNLKVILIADMETSHIQNCIKMIENNYRTDGGHISKHYRTKYNWLREELNKRNTKQMSEVEYYSWLAARLQ